MHALFHSLSKDRWSVLSIVASFIYIHSNAKIETERLIFAMQLKILNSKELGYSLPWNKRPQPTDLIEKAI